MANSSGNNTKISFGKEAKAAMNRMKAEVASDLGVNLKEGYNGPLTARENGHVGGEMVRRMIRDYQQKHSN